MPRSFLPLLMLLAVGCAKDTELALPTPTMLSEAGVDDLGATYSPDGSRVAGWRRIAGAFELWLADGDLGNLRVQGVKNSIFSTMAWSPDGTRLATSLSGASSWSVVTIPAAGGEVTPVYSGSGFVSPINWSADGTKLLVLASQAGGLIATLVVDVATGMAAPLIPGEDRPHVGFFAPVGQHAVIMVFDAARTTLWAMDSLGATPRPLTSEGFEAMPSGVNSWSADGRELVYESTRTGEPDLWVLDFATGETRQLTADLRADRNPSWSADGQWILFKSERGRQTDLWVVPASGGDAIRLTNDVAIESPIGWRGQTHEVAYTVEGGSGALLSVPVAGGDERPLTPDSVKVDYFALSPDGSQVAFTSRRTGSVLDIWVMPSGGGAARLLASPLARQPQVFWSPDGSKLAFLGVGGGTSDPWVLDVASGALQQVLAWNSIEPDLMWGSSSAELLVVSDRDSRLFDLWRVPLDGGEPVRLTTEGRTNGLLTTLDGGSRILVNALGGAGSAFPAAEVLPDGKLRTILDTETVWGVASGTPAGSDSVLAVLDGGAGQTKVVMMSLADGGFRQVGPLGAWASRWSRGGSMVSYAAGNDRGSTIGVVDLRTGTNRTISSGAGFDVGAEFLPGDSVVVFRRNRPENRIAVMDLADLLTRTP